MPINAVRMKYKIAYVNVDYSYHSDYVKNMIAGDV